MPTYTLKYFDARARGEIIRLLLASKGIEFKEERYTQETWPAAKPKIKFGQLPVMEIDGKFLSESVAMQRYLARELGMSGSTSWEVYEIDQIMGICQDLFDKAVKSIFEKDPAKKKELETALKAEHIPRYMANIEDLIKGKTKKFSVGNKMSLGDIAIFEVVDERISDEELKDCPCVLAVVNNVRNDPKIKKYLEQRKKTPF